MKTYNVNEVFYSLQGEGIRAGTANVFVRFAGCNLACEMTPGPKSPGGFDCDTEFNSSRKVTIPELLEWIRVVHPKAGTDGGCRWIIMTGGEPALQADSELLHALHDAGFSLAVETNGSLTLPKRGDVVGGRVAELFDWITISPKVAEHAIRQMYADEIKYVRGYGQAIPRPRATATHRLISPAFDGTLLDRDCLRWCIELVKENPEWQLSVQQHKLWNVR